MVSDYLLFWYKRAYNDYLAIYEWYKNNRGVKSANKFKNDINKTIDLIVLNPFIGSLDENSQERKLEYRSLLIHPYYRIIYYLKDQTIYIVSIRDNRRLF